MVSISPLVWLHEKYKNHPWFHSVEEEPRRKVVYVHYMTHEILKEILDWDGQQIVVHFAANKTVNASQFVSSPQATTLTPAQFVQSAKEAQAKGIDTGFGQIMDELDKEVFPLEEEKSLRYLQNELDKLEKVCGSRTLQDIFYEVQDGRNAVTNMSARYPDVRKSLERLYDLYGFDVIYEELDG